ncbi:MAG TPA: glycosyltransferase [Terracidiphilus sp.]|nr:glycosyltransferase [Terracidiphilus sp.]
MPAEYQKWHFGVLSFTGTGHLIPLLSLAQELKQRGHRVTFFEKPKIKERVLQAGVEFIPINAGANSKPKNPPKTDFDLLSELSTLRFNLNRIIHDVQAFLEETPPALTDAGVNALIVNEVALSGPTVAQMLGIPYFIISTSVPHNFGWNGFPWFSGYRYSPTSLPWVQRVFLELSCLRMRGPIRHALDRSRRQVGLGPVRELPCKFPCLSHITQLPQCLDLPRSSLPRNFFYAGPFESSAARPSVDFPWDRLDGRPLIYATLGTTRNVQPLIFQMIAEACQGLHTQLVISLGNRFDPASFADLPGQPLVTRYAPQLELLRIAQIVITHGGSNTVFETLMAGKPMIAIPLAYDQPAIAARLKRLQIAEVLPVMKLSSKRIREAITKLLNERIYHDSALEMQSRIRSLSGTKRAVDVIEQSLDRYLIGQLPKTHAASSTPVFDSRLSSSEQVMYPKP